MTSDPGPAGPDTTANTESGAIPLSEVAGPVDLQATLKSGQTYLFYYLRARGDE